MSVRPLNPYKNPFDSGDKVRRKPEFQNGRWLHGDKILTVSHDAIYDGCICFVEIKDSGDFSNFELVEAPKEKA